ncbi:MAG: FAD:protein FMN transferase [Gemmatimonadota bacterium]
MSETRGPDRRQFLGIGLGAFAVAALPGVIRPGRSIVRRSVPVMGTVADLAVVTRDGRHGQRAIDAALAELRRVEALMTRFRDDSDVGRSNLEAARRAVPVSSETAGVVGEALRWARLSGGAFDPALGRATALWDVGRRHTPPADDAVHGLAGRQLWRAVEVDTDGSVPRLRFHDPDAALDLGGIAKGYGVDRAAAALREHGAFDALVNVGGDLRVMGLSEDRDLWAVGVRSPESPDRMLTTLHLTDAAVATSGDYLQYFVHGGRRYHHLLDPRAAAPRTTGTRTLTVVAGTCIAADAAATTAFGLDPARAGGVVATAGRGARIAHRA